MMAILPIPQNLIYSRTPEIETTNLSQSHVGLYLSQFRAYFVFRRN